MTEMLYVVTADVLDREEDGTSHEDGSRVFKTYPRVETWAFPASTPIGDIMNAVENVSGVIRVTITKDRVSARRRALQL